MSVLELSADAYHADNLGDTPTLSSSIAKILCERSPAHAWVAHPKLNPNFERKEDDKYAVGTVAHELFLQGKDRIHLITADNYKTQAARDERDLAKQHGMVPLLLKHRDEVFEMVDALTTAVGHMFVGGDAESTLAWLEDGVACRARVDWLSATHDLILDLKTTTRSAEPRAWVKSSLFANGYDIQQALYRRGVKAITGRKPDWRWVVVETTPPYALSVIAPDPSVEAIGDDKVDHALGVWRDCLATGEWPAYTTRVAFAETPAYEESRWLESTVMSTVAS